MAACVGPSCTRPPLPWDSMHRDAAWIAVSASRAVAALAMRLKGRDSDVPFLSSDEGAVWEWEKTAHGPLPSGFPLQCAALESNMGI